MVITPSRKALVGAHYGLADWLLQRITAVLMLAYTLLALGIVLWHGGMDHERFVTLFQSQIFRVVTFLYMVSLAYHAWVGMRNIAMDYVKPLAIRLTLESVIVAVLIAYVGWTIGVLWG